VFEEASIKGGGGKKPSKHVYMREKVNDVTENVVTADKGKHIVVCITTL
jgi:hypothetical protein